MDECQGEEESASLPHHSAALYVFFSTDVPLFHLDKESILNLMVTVVIRIMLVMTALPLLLLAVLLIFKVMIVIIGWYIIIAISNNSKAYNCDKLIN